MRIRGAIGLGIAILIFKVLTPFVYAAFAETLIALFQTMHESINVTASIIHSVTPVSAP